MVLRPNVLGSSFAAACCRNSTVRRLSTIRDLCELIETAETEESRTPSILDCPRKATPLYCALFDDRPSHQRHGARPDDSPAARHGIRSPRCEPTRRTKRAALAWRPRTGELGRSSERRRREGPELSSEIPRQPARGHLLVSYAYRPTRGRAIVSRRGRPVHCRRPRRNGAGLAVRGPRRASGAHGQA